MSSHNLPLRVYYEDTDAGGIVYYANYLKFAERGRTEWLRDLGFHNSTLRAECGILIVVKAAEIDYIKSAVLDDSLVLETRVDSVGGSSLKMTQFVTRGDDLICTMKIVLVCVSAQTMRPARWPQNLREKLTT